MDLWHFKKSSTKDMKVLLVSHEGCLIQQRELVLTQSAGPDGFGWLVISYSFLIDNKSHVMAKLSPRNALVLFTAV